MHRFWKWLLRGFMALIGGWIIFSVALVVTIILYGNRDAARPADTIIVLGAGLEADGSPSKTMTIRAEHGADLWKHGIAPVVICTGGATGKSTRTEAEGCEEVLIASGVPAANILSEDRSVNTAGNVHFTRELMQQNGMETAVVVSSRYHMLRARWLYWRADVPVVTSPAEIAYLTTGEILFSYTREWAAFHWQVLRDWFDIPHIVVPVP